ncbi:MAG: low-specificity L-threonine aldolase [Gemmatales bacterium]|nr:low-specificity L-threonine aldolase [Gemmatales bacterium]MCS7161296.1 low-specificity L-threonine aldolase [Gemmatales bacterium]MDW8176499.1 low-specificity L-threonine aldolase [Gemmatales bacterium]MDW8223704.1 low-specificity L-threonine aldolase [Gemmatales bacterium]
MPERAGVIDLRSDTVTRPTPGMRAAMATAEVGDDVFGEDPTVRQLEEHVAELLGKEAALFVPSGTMSNQICIKIHTQPGDELICDVNSHIYNYEAGGPAVLSGVTCRTIEGDCGIFDLSQLEGLIRPENDHLVRTRLVCLENTHNRGGGRIFPLQKIRAITEWAHRHGLFVHLDGARLWNASVATGIPLHDWARDCDSVSVCFSKGLGAPVGSALAGSKELVKRARRIRKLLGGGMRQAGVLAAAALYAIKHHWSRLAEDHEHAQILAQTVRHTPGLRLFPSVIETNILYADIDPRLGTAADLAQALRERGVLVLPVAQQRIRLVTHLDVSRAQVERAAALLEQTARYLATRAA